jgi:hypothetical protein
MLKKDILFGSVVLLLAALFALTGCSQATDSERVTVYSENHLFGTADWEDVARAVKSARDSNRSVVLTDQLVIVGVANATTVADFGDLPVRVEGSVTVGETGGEPVIVNAAYANLTFAENARITIEENGAFIYNGEGENIYTNENPATPGFKVKFVSNPLEGAQGTDAHIAVANYVLGAGFTNVAPHITNLYVVDKITVNAASGTTTPPGDGLTPGEPRIIALGAIDLTESNTAAFVDLDQFVFTADSVLTSSVPGTVTIGLGATAGLPTVKAATPITVAASAGTVTALTINKIEGPETVTISGTTKITALTINNIGADGKVAVTSTPEIDGAVTIGNNAGSIDITTATFGGTFGLPLPGANTGSITLTVPAIAGAVTVANNAGTIDLAAGTASDTITVAANTGDIKFSKDFTGGVNSFLKVPANSGVINFLGNFATGAFTLGNATPADSVSGSGKVVFGNTAGFGANTIIGCDTEFNGALTRSAGTLLLGGNVTLAPGLGITLTGITTLTLGANKRILVGNNPVLATGDGNVVLTPATGAVLAAGEEDPEDEESVAYKTLTLGTAKLTVTSGNLRVPGVLNLAFSDGLEVLGSLTIEEGGIVAFPALATAMKLTIGDTVITGAAAESGLTASGGPVTLSPNTISGSGSTLAALLDSSPTITVAADNKLLTITGANLDLVGGGSLVITGHTNHSKVLLSSGKNPGRITLSETTSSFSKAIAGRTIAGGSINGGVAWGDEVTNFPMDVVWYIAATEAANLTIEGQTGSTTTIVAEVGIN